MSRLQKQKWVPRANVGSKAVDRMKETLDTSLAASAAGLEAGTLY